MARPSAPPWEKALTVLLLFTLTKPFFYREGSGSSFGILEYGPSGNAYLAFVYGITFLLVLRQGRAAWRVARADLLMLLLVALAIVSSQWSLEPYITFRAGVLLAATTLSGVYLAALYTRREQVELAAAALTLAAVLSLLAGLVAPSYGITETNWQGVFLHKNNLGRFMALGTVTCALSATREGPWRGWALAGAALSTALVFLSGSSTAIVVVAAAAVLAPLYAVLAGQLHLAVAVGSAALLVAGSAVVLFMSSPGEALQALGREATLTGRTALWGAVVAFISVRPWLGYGYQAFWFGDEGTADIKDVAGWAGASAHNGFLDLALGIGLVGLALFTLGFLVSVWRASANLRRARGLEAIWPLVFLGYFFLYNLTETSVLLPNNLLWVMYVATTLSLRWMPSRPPRQPAKAARYGRVYSSRSAASHGALDVEDAFVPPALRPRR